jgi:hypothetical protein
LGADFGAGFAVNDAFIGVSDHWPVIGFVPLVDPMWAIFVATTAAKAKLIIHPRIPRDFLAW